jgi:membrane protein YqaA with SNARE-associated domain
MQAWAPIAADQEQALQQPAGKLLHDLVLVLVVHAWLPPLLKSLFSLASRVCNLLTVYCSAVLLVSHLIRMPRVTLKLKRKNHDLVIIVWLICFGKIFASTAHTG